MSEDDDAMAELGSHFDQSLVLTDVQTGAEVGMDDEVSDTNSETTLETTSVSFSPEPIYNTVFGATPLIIATRTNNLRQMARLLRCPGNIDQADNYGNTALHYAAIGGFMDGVNLLINFRCNLNAQSMIGISPLMEAIFNRHIDVAKRLVEAGASPYILSASLESALTHAASMNYYELFYYMMNAPSEPGPRKRALDYALVHAAKNKNVVFADALLSRGAEIHLSVPFQVPLLNISAGLGDDILAMKWIHAGANVESRDFIGLTPLMHAAISGHLSTCQLLLSHGANPSAEYEGNTAGEMAFQRGHKAIALYLQLWIC
nr:ankyrin repeat and KH domain containing protein [Hymenolepis microstoma]